MLLRLSGQGNRELNAISVASTRFRKLHFEFESKPYEYATFYKKAESVVNSQEVELMNRYAKKVMSRPPVAKDPDEDDDTSCYQKRDSIMKIDRTKMKVSREAFLGFR